MMKRSLLSILIVFLFFNSRLLPAQIKDRFSVEFSERFRFLSWDNAISLADSARAARTFTRHRTSVAGRWLPSADIILCLKLTNEFRYYFVPEEEEFSFDEIFVDQLYVRMSMPFKYKVTLTVGRQNLTLGEGFVVMDGHPLDGSRSIYFNAVRLDWIIKSEHKITAFYSYQTERDDWLPIVHDRKQALVEQPEEGIGIYYTGASETLGWHTYYVRKNVDDNNALPIQSSINTIGSRLNYPVMKNIDYVIETAYQFGKRNNADRSAWGGYMYVNFRPGWKEHRKYLPSSVAFGGIYLSGDDPKTSQWEDWDPIFARWPKWSESYIYTQIKEDLVAYWTNLISVYGRIGFSFGTNVHLDFDYHHLMAPHPADETSAFPGGGGKVRGDLFIGKLTYKFDRYWSGHILWEGFSPGDYYFDSADGYSWLRTELMFRF